MFTTHLLAPSVLALAFHITMETVLPPDLAMKKLLGIQEFKIETCVISVINVTQLIQ